MKVIVVGGCGRIGTMVVPALTPDHDVRVTDLVRRELPDGVEFVAADVTSYKNVRAAMDDQRALIYLAMGPMTPWGETGGWAEGHFDVNAKGLYLTLRAAADAGVRQVIYASTTSIFENYLEHGRDLDDREPDATDGYGLSKRLGEQVCEAACREHGMGVVALRLCAPLPDKEWRATTAPALRSGRLPAMSVRRLLRAGLRARWIRGVHSDR